MVVLGVRFAVAAGSAACEDGGRGVRDAPGHPSKPWRMLGESFAQQLLCAEPVLSPYQMKLKSPISSLLVTHRGCLGRDVPPGVGNPGLPVRLEC